MMFRWNKRSWEFIICLTFGISHFLLIQPSLAQTPTPDPRLALAAALLGGQSSAQNQNCAPYENAFATCQQNNFTSGTLITEVAPRAGAKDDGVIRAGSVRTTSKQVPCGNIFQTLQTSCSSSDFTKDYKDSKKACADALVQRGKSQAKVSANGKCLAESQNCDCVTKTISAMGVDLSAAQWAASTIDTSNTQAMQALASCPGRINPSGATFGGLYLKACPAVSLKNSKAQKGALAAMDKKLNEINKSMQDTGKQLNDILVQTNDYVTKSTSDLNQAQKDMDNAKKAAASALNDIKKKAEQDSDDFTNKITEAQNALSELQDTATDTNKNAYDEAMLDANSMCDKQSDSKAQEQVSTLKASIGANKSLSPALQAYRQSNRTKLGSDLATFKAYFLQLCQGSTDYLRAQRKANTTRQTAQLSLTKALIKQQAVIEDLKRRKDTSARAALSDQQVAALDASNQYAAAIRDYNAVTERQAREKGIIDQRQSQLDAQIANFKSQQQQITRAKQMICQNPTYAGTDIPNDPHCTQDPSGALADIEIPNNLATTTTQCEESDYKTANEAYYTGLADVQAAQSQCCSNQVFRLDQSMSGMLQSACTQTPQQNQQGTQGFR